MAVVFGKDIRAAADVARRVRSGTVHVNGGFASVYDSADGRKHGGLGGERRADGIGV